MKFWNYRFFSKKVLVFFIILLWLAWSATITLAQSPTPSPSSPQESPTLLEYQKTLKKCATSDQMNLDCWIGGSSDFDKKGKSGVLPSILNAMTTSIVGPVPEGDILLTDYQPGGAVGHISAWITAMYRTQPASSLDYLAYVATNLHIVPKAYAQGIGSTGLNALLPFWTAMRNLSYLLFVVIFVVFGFSIMFRVQLDPRTVITIQNSLPRIITCLILVTFSYAITSVIVKTPVMSPITLRSRWFIPKIT